MTAEELESGRDFGRYLDVDGDGIPFRTLPGAHATRGAYFTRGSTRDAYARYSEAGSDYVYNMERLLQKFDSAKAIVPQPLTRSPSRKANGAVLYYGSTGPRDGRSAGPARAAGVHLDSMRIRAFPFSAAVEDFIAGHERVFVVEQNRDAQMRTLLVNELAVMPARLGSDPALRRHADHRAFHRQGDRGSRQAEQRSLAEERQGA